MAAVGFVLLFVAAEVGAYQHFEVFPMANPPATRQAKWSRLQLAFTPPNYEHPVGHGNIFTLHNPIDHFSLLPPLKGCVSSGGGGRSKPTDTAAAGDPAPSIHKNSSNNVVHELCHIATNAGFFDVHTGACLGNLVSDGTWVQQTDKNNAQFGVTEDGFFLVGSLNKNLDDRDTFFQSSSPMQLVSGVIWLVRNSTNYVSVSAAEEDMSQQATGSSFVSAQSARTAIGHNAAGELIIAVVDGKTWQYGINLPDFADLLVRHGVVNAINLDGGGSATLALEGHLANYPSDWCMDTVQTTTCERAVTSITCVHDSSTQDVVPESPQSALVTVDAGWYKGGDTVRVTLAFDNPVSIVGVPGIRVLVGETALIGRAVRPAASTFQICRFQFLVSDGLSSSEGIAIVALDNSDGHFVDHLGSRVNSIQLSPLWHRDTRIDARPPVFVSWLLPLVPSPLPRNSELTFVAVFDEPVVLSNVTAAIALEGKTYHVSPASRSDASDPQPTDSTDSSRFLRFGWSLPTDAKGQVLQVSLSSPSVVDLRGNKLLTSPNSQRAALQLPSPAANNPHTTHVVGWVLLAVAIVAAQVCCAALYRFRHHLGARRRRHSRSSSAPDESLSCSDMCRRCRRSPAQFCCCFLCPRQRYNRLPPDTASSTDPQPLEIEAL